MKKQSLTNLFFSVVHPVLQLGYHDDIKPKTLKWCKSVSNKKFYIHFLLELHIIIIIFIIIFFLGWVNIIIILFIVIIFQ